VANPIPELHPVISTHDMEGLLSEHTGVKRGQILHRSACGEEGRNAGLRFDLREGYSSGALVTG
jgi:hypothetical protein